MNDLAAAHTFLSRAMLHDNRLTLLTAVAWLDPLYTSPHDREALYYGDDEGDMLRLGLDICRVCFPDLYAKLSQLGWQGADDRTLTQHILDGINAAIDVDVFELEQLWGGIPLQAIGINLDEPEFYDDNPDLAALLGDLGMNADATRATGTVAETFSLASRTACVLRDDLAGRDGATYCDLARLLAWLFSSSGNTLVDMSNSDLYDSGLQMPDWTPDDVEFAQELIAEASEFLTSARDGQRALEADPILRAALKKNARRVSRVLQRTNRKEKTDAARHWHLRWPERP